MIFRKILEISSVLTTGFVVVKYGIFKSSKWTSTQSLPTCEKQNLNAFQRIRIGCPIVFAEHGKTSDTVLEAYERLKKHTKISDKILRDFPENYVEIQYEDYFLFFDLTKMNPAIVYEFLTKKNINNPPSVWKDTKYQRGKVIWTEDEDTGNKKIRWHKWKDESETYKRGHMAASGNHTQGKEINQQTNKFVNAAPQLEAVDGGIWKTLENFARTLVDTYGKVHIFSGPIYLLEDGALEDYILETSVQIPTHFFKIIIVEIDAKEVTCEDVQDGQPQDEIEAPEPEGAYYIDPEAVNSNTGNGPQFHMFAFLVAHEAEGAGVWFIIKDQMKPFLLPVNLIDDKTKLYMFLNSTFASESPHRNDSRREFTDKIEYTEHRTKAAKNKAYAKRKAQREKEKKSED